MSNYVCPECGAAVIDIGEGAYECSERLEHFDDHNWVAKTSCWWQGFDPKEIPSINEAFGETDENGNMTVSFTGSCKLLMTVAKDENDTLELVTGYGFVIREHSIDFNLLEPNKKYRVKIEVKD